MTAEEIKAKELGCLLFGAKKQLLDAKKLINEVENPAAWGSVWQAIQNTEQAIAYLRQSYQNADASHLASLASRTRLIDVLGINPDNGQVKCSECEQWIDKADQVPVSEEGVFCTICANDRGDLV